MITKTIITTLDNLSNLQESVAVLRDEPIDEIIVVNNGSIDGTQEWLATQQDLTVINRQNNGAGPGRNAGLDAAGKFDYVLMLDGGIRPLRGGTQKMLDYLSSNLEADVIGIEIPNFETNRDKAHRRWPNPITKTYQNTRLSHTAYCLCRYRAWDGLRFCEDGPFGESGWGADDDEMAYQWNEAGVSVHVVTGVHPYRHASGSFGRLYRETGIWPNQYGSTYEKRIVWLKHHWAKYEPPGMWGEAWLTVFISGKTIKQTAELIIKAHTELRKRRFNKPWQSDWNPYQIIVLTDTQGILDWSADRHLRQFHGDVIYGNGKIIKHKPNTEAKDFRLNTDDKPHYYGYISTKQELDDLINKYNQVYPHKPTKEIPQNGGLIR